MDGTALIGFIASERSQWLCCFFTHVTLGMVGDLLHANLDVMDESLNALSNILSQIAEQPLNVALHIQHIQIASSQPGLNAELMSAMEMMTEFLAADPEHVWLPLIKQRESSLNFDSSAGVEELLALYERAESDYLCKCVKHII